MALILCTGVDPVLLQTRKQILEQAGHTVVTTIDQPQLAAACAKHRFDVAVIEQAMDPRMRKIVASLIREQCPAAKILELYPPQEARVVADADAWLEAPEAIPKDLVERVNQLLQHRRPAA
jgi:CheY-like chemotaxis protein